MDGQESETPSAGHVSNGHDTLSDFVTFVCQESEQTSQNVNRNSPKYTQYNAMLPPPPVTGPLPPMAVPVAAGYSGEEFFLRGSIFKGIFSKGIFLKEYF